MPSKEVKSSQNFPLAKKKWICKKIDELAMEDTTKEKSWSVLAHEALGSYIEHEKAEKEAIEQKKREDAARAAALAEEAKAQAAAISAGKCAL